jgi:WD40-like Beta Propeller Repeat
VSSPVASGVLYLRSAAGSERRLVAGADPTWSADGRRLAFVVDARTGGNDLAEVEVSSRRVRADEALPAWRPTG